MIQRIEVDQRSLTRLVTALRQESDGKALTRDLVQKLERIAEPALLAARAELMAMESHSNVQPGLRSTVVAHTEVEVKLGGKRPGVSIRAHKTGMPRGFANAPKRLNEPRGWRRRVFGTNRWVVQMGRPGWFDDTIPRFKPAAERAAGQALDEVARRIDMKTRG